MSEFLGMRRISVNLLLMMGALLLVFGALEGVLRLLAKAAPIHLNQHKVCCEHDPQLGWRHVANRTVTFQAPEYRITERFNSRGVRGPEYSLEKGSDEYRIVVLGDSFAEGYTVDFEELFSEVLKQRLNEQERRRVEVINFGVGGYSTDQELLLFQNEGIHYHPDLVILMFHDSDVWYNAQKRYFPWRRGYKPLFCLKGDALHLTNVPVPILAEEASFQTQIQATFAHHSYLYRWIRDRVKNSSTLFSLAISLGLADPGKTFIPKEYRVYQNPYSPEIHEAWLVTAALLAKLKQEARFIGSDLLVFHVPMRASVYTQEWEQVKQHYALPAEGWHSEKVNLELGGVLARLEIEFLNPLKCFRQRAKDFPSDGDRLYFKRDGHWNRKGHRLAGEMLAEAIVQSRFFQD